MISVEVAALHALFHLASIGNGGQPAYGTSQLSIGILGDSATFYDAVYLATQEPVVHVFDVTDSAGRGLGHIAVNATPNIGRTFAFLRGESDQLIALALEKAQDILLAEGFRANQILPVVYSFPKLGLLGKSETRQLLVDLLTLEAFEPDATDPLDVQGRAVWSFWDEQPQAGDPTKNWRAESTFIKSMVAPHTPPLASPLLMATNKSQWYLNRLNSPSNQVAKNTLTTTLLNMRSQVDKTPPATDTFVLATNQIGQENSVYCACASLQMMYEFVFDRRISQQEVATVMKTTGAGSTVSGQMAAFRHFFAPRFEAILDRSPSIGALRESLTTYLPVKSGIAGHARVAAGYRRDLFADPITGQARLVREMLLIIDPEPIGKGTIRWDAFDPSALKDFILLKRAPQT